MPETKTWDIIRSAARSVPSQVSRVESAEIRLRKKLLTLYRIHEVKLSSSARAGLYWILKALKPPRIYLPAYLCSSIYECASRARTPITYLDLIPGSFEAQLEGITFEPSSVLLLVHQYGIPSNPQWAREISDKYGLVLVEDNAAALGASWDGIPTGSFGSASIVSFEYSKTISACKGGATLFKDKGLANKYIECVNAEAGCDNDNVTIKWLIDATKGVLYDIALNPVVYGSITLPVFRLLNGPFVDRSQTIELGGDYPNNFGAARANLVMAMLERLPEIISGRRQVAKIYEEVLSSIRNIKLVRPAVAAQPVYTHYPILLPRGTREKLVRKLWSYGVDPGFNFSYLCGGNEAVAVAPVSEDYTHRIITLPVSSRITPQLAEKIAVSFRQAAIAAGIC
jgi:dTDP-4-amino-4,6-dideoxygalactose transaminase